MNVHDNRRHDLQQSVIDRLLHHLTPADGSPMLNAS
jgi:hypothetical protein